MRPTAEPRFGSFTPVQETGRRRLLLIVIAVAVVSLIAGWVASSRIQSPAEIAAGTAAPLASPILVPAESRVLSTDVVARGTGRFGSPQQLFLAPSALKTNIGVPAWLPKPGTELREGDLIFTASGRPVFLLQGAQPAFRDLGPGTHGEDVRQLEEALVRLGFSSGPADDTYDAQTESAVSAWYETHGFAAFAASAEQVAAVRALESEKNASQIDLIGARDAVAKAQLALDTARAAHGRALDAASTSSSAIRAAELRAWAANDAAAAEVAARAAVLDALLATPPTVPATQAEIAAAEADLALALANAEVVRIAGEQAIADAVATGTPEDVAAATAQADAANRAAAADVAAKRAALDAVRAGTPGVPATAAEIAAAEGELGIAQNNAEVVQLAGEREIAEARAASSASRADLEDRVLGVKAAESDLYLSVSTLAVRTHQVDLVASQLGLAQLRAGVHVPADEVIFIATTPVRVAEAAAVAADSSAGPQITVTDASVIVDGSLRLEDASLVRPLMSVHIDEPDLGIATTGVVRLVADAPGTNGVDGFHVYVEVLVDEASPASLIGASVRLTIPVESTGGSVLTVPLSAVTLAADGSSRVQRQHDGVLEFVTVEPGLSADGYVAVNPVDGGVLKSGDLVVVGYGQDSKKR